MDGWISEGCSHWFWN